MIKAAKEKLTGNKKLASYIRRIINIEEQIEIHRKIKNITTSSINYNIQSIAIPEDMTLDWNKIPKTMPNDQWQTFIAKYEIEQSIIKRNKKHLN